jgi:hypothetical protein
VNETELAGNYGSSRESSFRLGPSPPGADHKVIVIAASVEGSRQLEATYKDMVAHAGDYETEAASYYRQYLNRTVALELPDAELQQAYDWARINMAQSLVENPFIGKGLIAGYRVDAGDRRPGYDWFFGRDALWTALALNASGDFQETRQALQFLSRFQRQDGKIPHEIPQSASLIGPLDKTAFAYASADATPLYLIAFDDYVTRSGDLEFARQMWATLEGASRYLNSTLDANRLARNEGSGHGWVEGGPLLPAHMEFYQAALGVEATRAWSHLARVTGHEDAGGTAAVTPLRWTVMVRRSIRPACWPLCPCGSDSSVKTAPMPNWMNWPVLNIKPIGALALFPPPIAATIRAAITSAASGRCSPVGPRWPNTAIAVRSRDTRTCAPTPC